MDHSYLALWMHKAKMSKPIVTYFNIPASRGFAIRAALRYAKVDFVDNRVRAKDFATEYKPNPTKAPLGSLPTLQIQEGLFGKIGLNFLERLQTNVRS